MEYNYWFLIVYMIIALMALNSIRLDKTQLPLPK